MIDKEIRELIPPDSIIFENPPYDNSIVGISNND